MGGVACQPFLNLQPLETGAKMILKGSTCFWYLVLQSTMNFCLV